VGALAERMDAGISPARTVHSDSFSGDLDTCTSIRSWMELPRA
jgi:hypothetical protein